MKNTSALATSRLPQKSGWAGCKNHLGPDGIYVRPLMGSCQPFVGGQIFGEKYDFIAPRMIRPHFFREFLVNLILPMWVRVPDDPAIEASDYPLCRKL
jgi:hypothetical protein